MCDNITISSILLISVRNIERSRATDQPSSVKELNVVEDKVAPAYLIHPSQCNFNLAGKSCSHVSGEILSAETNGARVP